MDFIRGSASGAMGESVGNSWLRTSFFKELKKWAHVLGYN